MDFKFQNEIDYFKSKNISCKIEQSNKFQNIEIQIRNSLVLRVILQEDYPLSWPVSVKIHSWDTKSLKSNRQEAILEFIKQTNLDLNSIIDSNQGKCVLIKLFEKILNCIEENQFVKECFEILDSRPKNQKFQERSILKTDSDSDSEKSKVEKKTSKKVQKEQVELKHKFKGSEFIFQRIKWDDKIDKNQVVIGYLDRFLGVKDIKFNDFKGVHDDRDGVPLHRIRYFKINDKIVWDREQKLDLITGVGDISGFFDKINIKPEVEIEQEKNFENQVNIIDGPILEFNSNEWSPTENTIKKPSFLCGFKLLTYNIMSKSNFSRSIKSRVSLNKNCGLENLDKIDRMPYIVSLIEKNNLDFILLQECELYEEEKLKENKFIQKNYFISSLERENELQKHSNCVILSKLKPLFFKSVLLSDNSNKSAQICKFEIRTNSLSKIEHLLLINMHLSSNKVNNPLQKRETQMRNLKSYLNLDDLKSDFTFICGDFNFSDSNTKENEILKELFMDFGFVDMVPNCFTFDPSSNFSSTITSSHDEKRRLDRILLKSNNSNLSLSKSLLVNTQPFKVTPSEPILLDDYLKIGFCLDKNEFEINENEMTSVEREGFYLNPSDHYGLECHFKFEKNLDQSKLVHKSALAVIIPKDLSDEFIQPIRELYDPQVNRWPPHMNILYPFYENIDLDLSKDEQGTVISDLFYCFMKHGNFDCEFTHLDLFEKNNVVFLQPCKKSENKLRLIYKDLKKLFEDESHSKWNRPELSPHLTIAQPVDKRKARKNWARDTLKEIEDKFRNYLNQKPILKFNIDCLYWITRTDSTPFQIRQAFPLGLRYPSILKKCLNTQGNLINFLISKKAILSEDDDLSLVKNSNLIKNLILNHVKNSFDGDSTNLIHIGSYQLGVKSNDLDLCLIKSKNSNTENLTEKLKNQMIYDDKFHLIRPINDAIVPIIEIELKESDFLSGVDVQIYEIDTNVDKIESYYYDNLNFMTNLNLPYVKLFALSAIFENQNLKKYVQYYKDFQIVLSFVKYWAKCRGIYGKAFGYLGGISWSLMVVVFLRRNFSLFVHELELDMSSERLEKILFEFFKFYSEWNWNRAVSILDIEYVGEILEKNEQKSPMMILQTVYPYHNTTKGVGEKNKKLIVKEIKRCYEILKSSNDYELACDCLFDEPTNKIEFQIGFNNSNDSNHLFTLFKAKILGLVTSLEKTLPKINFRPMIEFNDSDNSENFTENFNFTKKYLIYMYGLDKNGLNSLDNNFINECCSGFISSIRNLSHANEYDIKFRIQ
ncbi:unnamed protein product [Brachionus calyciflorus]|uniref:polynucleotide adenylyltransferase n=1 Tax=Brachionus calyciflorus TaxID=104777 RepID=A0A813VS50_9BILA|nr:unnamed protein product [Brachionus calyciflorus]